MSTAKIPKGWKRLREGTMLQRGDMYRELLTQQPPEWVPTSLFRYDRKGRGFAWGCIYIRRKASRTGATQARAKVGGKKK